MIELKDEYYINLDPFKLISKLSTKRIENLFKIKEGGTANYSKGQYLKIKNIDLFFNKTISKDSVHFLDNDYLDLETIYEKNTNNKELYSFVRFIR